jgi:CheY-like chemotaxis protein
MNVQPGKLVPSARAVRVLFVDAEEDALRTHAAVAEALELRAVLASGGYDALAMAKLSPLDVVVLSVRLPDLDGLDVVRRLKESPRTARLPVIALIPGHFDGLHERLLEAGCAEVFAKPCNVEALARAIRLLARANARRDLGEVDGPAERGLT